MLRVMEFNATAIHVYQKVGFREIGRRRECHWMGGRLWDMVYMDILASEFRSTIPTRIFVADEPRAQ